MIDTRQMTPAQIRRAAMDAVVREVGVVGLVHLLRDEIPKQGDYVADREKWLPRFNSIEKMMEAIGKEGGPEAPMAEIGSRSGISTGSKPRDILLNPAEYLTK